VTHPSRSVCLNSLHMLLTFHIFFYIKNLYFKFGELPILIYLRHPHTYINYIFLSASIRNLDLYLIFLFSLLNILFRYYSNIIQIISFIAFYIYIHTHTIYCTDIDFFTLMHIKIAS